MDRQTCFNQDQDKLAWFDKTETVLAIITTSFHGTIILIRDANINVKEDTEISQRYIEIFDNLDFK